MSEFFKFKIRNKARIPVLPFLLNIVVMHFQSEKIGKIKKEGEKELKLERKMYNYVNR